MRRFRYIMTANGANVRSMEMGEGGSAAMADLEWRWLLGPLLDDSRGVGSCAGGSLPSPADAGCTVDDDELSARGLHGFGAT